MIPIQLLTLGHTVRVCYDLTNYAELSINSNGDLTIHKLVGGSPKIIDKRIADKEIATLEVDSLGHPLNTPPTDRPLKVGDVLIYTNENKNLYSALTLDKEYPIRSNIDGLIIFTDDDGDNDYTSEDINAAYYYKNYFTLKP